MVTLQLVPYTEMETLSSLGKIRKLLNIAKQNKIVLLQGRLKKDEETELIKTTMEEINKDFKGIEMAVIDSINSSKAELKWGQRFRNDLFGLLLGDRQGLTIIGPASVVKAIKKDPHKIELYTTDKKKRAR